MHTEPVPAQNNRYGGAWQFPCNTTGLDVRITFGGKEYAFDARDLVLGPVDPQAQGSGLYEMLPIPATGMCMGAFMR